VMLSCAASFVRADDAAIAAAGAYISSCDWCCPLLRA
jgi:hypothetical protein